MTVVVSEQSPFLDVTKSPYNAKGDGSSDDSGAIQAAIDAVNAIGGGTVFIPSSDADYIIASSLTLYSGIHLVGDGRRRSRIKTLSTSLSGLTIKGASAAARKVQGSVSRIGLIGPGKASGGTGFGIDAKWLNFHWTFEDLWISDWGSHGAQFDDCNELSIIGGEFDGNGGHNIHAFESFNACTFFDVITVNAGGAGCYVKEGAGNYYHFKDAARNGTYGFEGRKISGGQISGYFELNGVADVLLEWDTGPADRSEGVVVTAAHMAGSPRGLVLSGVNLVMVYGNRFVNHVIDHIQTNHITNAARTWIGPNSYIGTGTNLTDLSATTGGVDYDPTNLWTRTRGKHYISGEVEIDGALNHDGNTVGFFGVAPAVRPAVYAATNVTVDRAFNANSTTLDEIADVLGTLIADLRTMGLVT